MASEQAEVDDVLERFAGPEVRDYIGRLAEGSGYVERPAEYLAVIHLGRRSVRGLIHLLCSADEPIRVAALRALIEITNEYIGWDAFTDSTRTRVTQGQWARVIAEWEAWASALASSD